MADEYIPKIKYLELHDKHTPRCTTKSQYDFWRSGAFGNSVNGFCSDCTPEFQKEKAAKGLCDHPEVLFYLDNDGLIEGSFDIRHNQYAIGATK